MNATLMNRENDVYYLTSADEVDNHELDKPQSTAQVRTIAQNREISPSCDSVTEISSVQGTFIKTPDEFSDHEDNEPVKQTKAGLVGDLFGLAHLVANLSEAFTAAIFVTDDSGHSLEIAGFHTLSREFIADSKIEFGSGLVGWCAQNARKISVCPFENDATTLCYYTKDQTLKSFIAVPVIGENGEMLGVLSCDSKKSYAFSKITEKLLTDCALQAATLIELHKEINLARVPAEKPINKSLLSSILDKLRAFNDEDELLTYCSDLSTEIINRESLVLISRKSTNSSPRIFRDNSSPHMVSNRLLELVCHHKKILSPDRSIHALPTDDRQQRSFLSVPFHVLGKETGSFNLLSRPHKAFDTEQISSLETIAAALGRELERIRLREIAVNNENRNQLASWTEFKDRATLILEDQSLRKTPHSLIRINIYNLRMFESIGGPEMALAVMQKLRRLVSQLVHQPYPSTHLYENEIMLLCLKEEENQLIKRFSRLIKRMKFADLSAKSSDQALPVPALGNLPLVNGSQIAANTGELGENILSNLQVVVARSPQEGTTVEQLCSHTLSLLQANRNPAPELKTIKPKEKRRHARSWW